MQVACLLAIPPLKASVINPYFILPVGTGAVFHNRREPQPADCKSQPNAADSGWRPVLVNVLDDRFLAQASCYSQLRQHSS